MSGLAAVAASSLARRGIRAKPVLRRFDFGVHLDKQVHLSENRYRRVISQTADYALRAIVCLASQPDSAKTTEQIAQGTHVPAGYLSKVLRTLGRANLVRSQRGLGGGFSLVRSASELSVLEVINAVDPIERITKCPLGHDEHGTRLCLLHQRLDKAIALIEDVFRQCTIADLLNDEQCGSPLCSPCRNDSNGEADES